MLFRSNRTLRGELENLCAKWQSELAAAEQRAGEAAASAHVRDDDKRLAALVGALGDARQSFDRHLLALVSQSASALAIAALDKLVSVREGDREWLARVIGQRLDRLDRGAVISVQVSEDDFADPVAAILPDGARIEKDAMLRGGTARITLRLGAIEIDPAAGLERLTDVLRRGEDG